MFSLKAHHITVSVRTILYSVLLVFLQLQQVIVYSANYDFAIDLLDRNEEALSPVVNFYRVANKKWHRVCHILWHTLWHKYL